MIALCANHSDRADGGAYTNEQLREFKRKPYLSFPLVSPGPHDWLRNELMLLAGNFYINPHIYVRLNGRNMIWCNRNQRNELELNLDIRDENDRSVVLMENNDWLRVGSDDGIDDIEAPPRGRSLTVKAKKLGISFAITFGSYDQNALQKLGEKCNLELGRRPGATGPIGPLGAASPEFLDSLLAKYGPGLERNLLLSEIQSNELIKKMPTKWEILERSFRSWPITVCTLTLKLEHPLLVDIGPGYENIEGLSAKCMVVPESKVVWDINAKDSGIGYLRL